MKNYGLVIFFTLTVFSCSGADFKKTELTIINSDGTPVLLQTELAITAEQQQHGFMQRKKIPEGTGMLFVFERDQIASFWMKDTPTALSIAYIDSSGRIRDILAMTPQSLEPVQSSVSVRYALEVPLGWFAKMNIQTGDLVQLPISGL